MTRIEHPNLFVISGGPGAGKTTALLELEKMGYRFCAEVARQIIQEQVKAGGTARPPALPPALPWADREAYTATMLQRSIESFEKHTPASGPSFADRGIPDTLAYARMIGLPDTAAIALACRRYRYAPVVFLMPPWAEIYRTDAERKQDFAEAERTYHGLAKVYEECGYRTVEVPKAEPRARAEFIREFALRHCDSR